MSLINDALQRAKRVHQNAAASSGSNLRFQPADPKVRQGKRFGLVLPATAATILAIGILSLALSNRKTTASNRSQTAAPHMAAEGPANPTANGVRGNTSPVTPAARFAGTSALKNPTNQTSLGEMEAPLTKPPPPKLQAIVFIPTRPSAILSGKTVVVGDRVNEFRVAAISPDSITLVSESETNVLRME